jgi:1-acyl-sn-glycerol-3-phosphate acyltransferase
MRVYSILDALLRPLLMRLYRVEVRGSENVPETGPAVVAANHESVLDGFFLALATRRQLRFMAKIELYRLPLARYVLDAAGAFPVDRSADDGRAVARGVEQLERGQLIGIFPQGTCLPYRLRPFKRGAARLALAAGAPLVPVALVGTERALRPHRIKIGLPRVVIVIGSPIPVPRRKADPEAETAVTEQLELAVEELRGPFGPPAHVWMDEPRPPRRVRPGDAAQD